MKKDFFSFLIKSIWLGEDYISRSRPEMGILIVRFVCLEVSFWTTLQNRKPQWPALAKKDSQVDI